MQEQLDLEVSARAERGKNAARRLRASGKAPGVLYGLGKEPVAISVDTRTLTRILVSRADRNRVLGLKGGAEGPAMAVDWQTDPITGALLHVDLRRVDLTRKVRVKIPFVTVGTSYGVRNEDGVEDMVLRQCLVECMPFEAPEEIEIDVTELALGQSIRLSQIDAGENILILGDPNRVVVHVVGRRAEEEEEAVEEAAVEGEEAAAAEGAEGGAAPADGEKASS